MFVVLIVLFVVALGLMLFLTLNNPKIVLPDPLRKKIGEMVGLEVLRGEQDDAAVQVDSGEPWHERKGVWDKPLTIFAEEMLQRGDGHILSRGFGSDGFERVMMRGQFGGWKTSPVGVVTGRRSLTVTTAGGVREVYVGQQVKMQCVERMMYDTGGQAHDLSNVLTEYMVYLDTAPLVETGQVEGIFSRGDEMALIARYSDGVFEAMMLVGFDCSM